MPAGAAQPFGIGGAGHHRIHPHKEFQGLGKVLPAGLSAPVSWGWCTITAGACRFGFLQNVLARIFANHCRVVVFSCRHLLGRLCGGPGKRLAAFFPQARRLRKPVKAARLD
jgi:hypothetical protein